MISLPTRTRSGLVLQRRTSACFWRISSLYPAISSDDGRCSLPDALPCRAPYHALAAPYGIIIFIPLQLANAINSLVLYLYLPVNTSLASVQSAVVPDVIMIFIGISPTQPHRPFCPKRWEAIRFGSMCGLINHGGNELESSCCDDYLRGARR